MKASGYEKNYIIILSLTIFFIYLFFQFSKIEIYYDDYGYYSLTYGIQSDFKGHSYTMSQLFSFLKEHYLRANGRLLYFFIWLFLYHIGGLKCVQLSAAVIVTAIFGLIIKIILEQNCKEKNVKKYLVFFVSVLCCLSYGVMEIGLLQFGMYWFAAMFHYVASLVPFLLFQILYFKEEPPNLGKQLLLLFLLFLSAWSEESWSVATVGFTILLAFLSLKNKRFCKWNIVYILGSLSGLFLVFFSPGIRLRMENHTNFYSLSIIGKVMYTLPRIMVTFWTMRLFQIVFWCGQF